MKNLTLAGKTAVVTGGASGIGAAIVEFFVELGATVASFDLRPGGASHGAAHEFLGDVTSEKDTLAATQGAIEAMGGVDILVNSAGISDTYLPTTEQTVASWQRIVDVDLTGTYLMCKAAGPHMLGRRSGAIVNISSVVGLGGFPRRNAYGASKAGVIMLTRSLACEWGGHGVRVNCVAPGYIRTPMGETLIAAGKIDVSRTERRTPLARLGRPQEIAHAVAYLSSDWATFVSGATLPVDGGWSAFAGSGDVQTA